MKTVGIICEYNPFHRGHLEQIEWIRAQFPDHAIVCMMSGSFVQRGEGAVFNKWVRAEAAIGQGADLVLELPYPWCASSAEHFARGGVSLLDRLGVEHLVFGSECGDLSELQSVADRLASAEYAKAMSEVERDEGESYVRRSMRVYRLLYGEGFPVSPNDILAVCYLRAITEMGARIKPHTYRRNSPYSATAAREAIRGGDDALCRQLIPDEALALFREQSPVPPLLPADLVLPFFRLYPDPIEGLCAYDGMSPGSPTRYRKMAMESNDEAQFYASLTSKRDTDARVRRSILAAVIGAQRETVLRQPFFTQMLAVSETGRNLLSTLRRKADPVILTKPASGKRLEGVAGEQFALALRAEQLYATLQGVPAADCLRRGPRLPK